MRRRCLYLFLVFVPVVFSDASFAAEPYTYQVDVDYIRLYDGPDESYPVRDVIEQGDSLQLLKRRGDWVKARSTYATEGWFQVGSAKQDRQQWRFALALNAGVDSLYHPISGLTLYARRQQPWVLGANVSNMTADFASTRFYQAFGGYEFSPWSRSTISVQIGGGVASQQVIRSLVGAADREWAGLLTFSFRAEWALSRFVSVASGISTWSVMPDSQSNFSILMLDLGVVRRF